MDNQVSMTEEKRAKVGDALATVEEWHNFLEDFVDDPNGIARVKNQPLQKI